MYLLDTMVVSEFPKRNRNPNVARWLGSKRPEEVFVSVITPGEIRRGIALQEHKDPEFAQRLQRWLDGFIAAHKEHLLPVSMEIALAFGDISAAVGNTGIDNLIAATAKVHNLTVATRNIRHFELAGVSCVNPWE